MATIDDYVKLEKIGEGTYGVVYKVCLAEPTPEVASVSNISLFRLETNKLGSWRL